MLKPQGQVVFVIAFLQQIAIQQASPPESARALSAPRSSIGYHYALPNPDEGDSALAVVSRVTLQTSSIGRCCRCDGETHSSVAANYAQATEAIDAISTQRMVLTGWPRAKNCTSE